MLLQISNENPKERGDGLVHAQSQSAEAQRTPFIQALCNMQENGSLQARENHTRGANPRAAASYKCITRHFNLERLLSGFFLNLNYPHHKYLRLQLLYCCIMSPIVNINYSNSVLHIDNLIQNNLTHESSFSFIYTICCLFLFMLTHYSK